MGPWTHVVTVGPNGNDNREHYYAIWVTKTGRHIMQNTKHIQGTTISPEQYAKEQIRKEWIGLVGGHIYAGSTG